MPRMHCRRDILGTATLLLVAGGASVGAIVAHAEETMLALTGAAVPGGALYLSKSAIADVGLTNLVTETPWTEGLVTFTGVLVRDLLDHYRITGTAVEAQALNDYRATIPVADFYRYDVLLACKADGVRLTPRDKGPFWLVYPWSDVPELDNRTHHQRSVWQIRQIEVAA